MLNNYTVEQNARVLAHYLPNGKSFEAKNIQGSNLKQLLTGLAYEMQNAQRYITTLDQQYLPDQAILFIEEWESALGIPDSCFNGDRTVEERSLHILVKLASLGIQTADDFEELALLFGIVVEVKSGYEGNTFPMEFPFLFFNNPKDANYTIIIRFQTADANVFPYTFPLTFGQDEINILRCLFSKLKPANCQVIFQQV